MLTDTNVSEISFSNLFEFALRLFSFSLLQTGIGMKRTASKNYFLPLEKVQELCEKNQNRFKVTSCRLRDEETNVFHNKIHPLFLKKETIQHVSQSLLSHVK